MNISYINHYYIFGKPIILYYSKRLKRFLFLQSNYINSMG